MKIIQYEFFPTISTSSKYVNFKSTVDVLNFSRFLVGKYPIMNFDFSNEFKSTIGSLIDFHGDNSLIVLSIAVNL